MTFTIRCGKCSDRHTSVDAVRACHAGMLTTCGWTVELPGRWMEDESGEWAPEYIEGGFGDCGAETIHTDRGWTCAAGHEHVNMETRHAERWDYAEDFGEAMNLARAGVEPLTMSGHLVLGPQSFVGA